MPEKERFSRRTGHEGMPKLKGMNKTKDPSSIPDDEFAHLVNVRIKGGRIVSRGGQDKVHNDQLPGCPEGIFPIDEPPCACDGAMWFNSRDNLFITRAGSGTAVNEDPPFHPSLIIGHHDGEIWLRSQIVGGPDNGGYRVSTITDDETAHTVLFSNFSGAGTPISTILGETFKQSGGNVYIATKGGVVPAILSWDGATRVLDYSHGGSGDFGCGPFFEIGSSIFAFISGRLYKRIGVLNWTIQSPTPVPFVALGTHDGLVYGGTAFVIGSGGYDIYTWDGAAAGLTLVHTIPITTGSTGQVVRIFSFDTNLYYLYAKPRLVVGGVEWILGRYDGVAWNDEYFTFTDEIALGGTGLTDTWLCVGPDCVRGTPKVAAVNALTPSFAVASCGKNLAWFFKQGLNPKVQDLYLHTDSGQRSKFFYFID